MSKNIKRLCILCFFLMGYCTNILAQTGVSIDMTYGTATGEGKTAITGEHNMDIEGNPYLYDTWLLGIAKLDDGKTYKDIFLKYDILHNILIFKYNLKDSALAFKDHPLEFVLQAPDEAGRSMYFRNGFAATDGADDKTFYQVISQGNIKLLKRVKKRVQASHSDMNNNQVNRTIVTSDSYYIAKGDAPVLIKNDKRAILNALSDKSAELQKYITDNHLDMKKDEALKQLVDHYNEIKKS